MICKFCLFTHTYGSGEASLEGVFPMCSNSVDLYGLTGDNVRPGFITFFEKPAWLDQELYSIPL